MSADRPTDREAEEAIRRDGLVPAIVLEPAGPGRWAILVASVGDREPRGARFLVRKGGEWVVEKAGKKAQAHEDLDPLRSR